MHFYNMVPNMLFKEMIGNAYHDKEGKPKGKQNSGFPINSKAKLVHNNIALIIFNYFPLIGILEIDQYFY